ncbi:hypothetical protein Y88_0750 [Novosphingobium nitrogenifigens DSM 19370]|uniref:Uncharacterized protein n=1 Tax=Novosphingobium nitrogenifigens DSM 19370 TaxID=983920 RepID=F1Z9P9_9SPHN|nr:hypothetical protein Y88_0750 [Novosphingobium nitrogenifigens DSM 19370]
MFDGRGVLDGRRMPVPRDQAEPRKFGLLIWSMISSCQTHG